MTPAALSSWQVWAVLSAVFAALTAIFAKLGVEDINPDVATFIRTIIVLISLSLILFATGQFTRPGPISPKTWIFLVLSGLGTGASWLCYFRALKLGPATLVAPIDKLSVVLVALFGVAFLRRAPLGEWLAGHRPDCRRRSSDCNQAIRSGLRVTSSSHQQRHPDHDQHDPEKFTRRQWLLE